MNGYFRTSRGPRHFRAWARTPLVLSQLLALAMIAACLTVMTVLGAQRPASAAPAFVQTQSSMNAASGTTLTVSITATAGNALVVTAKGLSSSTYTCTDSKGDSFSAAIIKASTSVAYDVVECHAFNVAGGATTVTVTWGTAKTNRAVTVNEYSGIGSMDSNSSTAPASGTATTITSLGVHSGDLVFAVAQAETAQTATSQSGATQRSNTTVTSTGPLVTQDFIQPSAGTYTSVIAWGATTYTSMIAVVFHPASIVPTMIQSVTASPASTGSTISASLTTTAGNMIIVAAEFYASASPTASCSDDKSNLYSQPMVKVNSTDLREVIECHAYAAVGGATNVTVTITGTVPDRAMTVTEYSNMANYVTDVSNVGQGTASATASSGSATTTANGELVIGIAAVTNGSTGASAGAGSGFTLRSTNYTSANTYPLAFQDQVQASAGAVTSTVSWSGTYDWAALLITFKPASAGPAYVQGNGSSYGTSTTGTTATGSFSAPNTPGNIILVSFSFDMGQGNLAYCSDNQSNSYHMASYFTDTTTANQAVGMCYATNIKGGVQTIVTVSYAGTGTHANSTRRVIVAEYSGVASVATVDRYTTKFTTSGSAQDSGNITTTSNNGLIAGFMDTVSDCTLTAGSGFTMRVKQGDGTLNGSTASSAYEDKILTTAGTTSTSMSTGSCANGSFMMALALRSAGTAPDNGIVQSRIASSDTSGTALTAGTMTVTAGDYVVGIGSWNSTSTSFTCSDSQSNTFTYVTTKVDSGLAVTIGLCYTKIATTGSYNATLTTSTSYTKRRFIAAEYSGIVASSPVDVFAVGSGTSTATTDAATTASMTTTTPNDIIVSAFMDSSGFSINNAGTNFARQDSVNGTDLSLQDDVLASAGATTSTLTFTTTSHNYIAIAVAFKTQSSVTLTQSNWRVFNNTDSADVGSALAADNTAPTTIGVGTNFRIRVRVAVTGSTYTGSPAMRLQVATMSGSCDTAFSGETYSDVVAGSGGIRFYDNTTPADGATATANANDPAGNTKVMQTYEEANNTGYTSSVAAGSDGLWDFSLTDNSAATSTSFCFRLVQSTGTVLDAYSTVAQITTVAPNNAPAAPTATLSQKRSDQSTAIPAGGYTNENQVYLYATVTDPDGDQVQLCAEVAATLTSPASPATCGPLVNSGTTALVNVTGLVAGTAYKWQVKAKDSNAAYSATYTQFNSGSTAFTVDQTAPSAGTVNDGPTANTDVGYNTGSLSSLSCNWAAYTDALSGVTSYDVAIGTTPGGTEISTGATGATSGWFVGVGTYNAGWYTYTTGTVLSLQTGQTYYCNVRAKDVAGNGYTAANSNGQVVAPTMTFSLGASSITFANLKASNSYTDTKTLSISAATNAYRGYKILSQSPALLTSSAGKTIPAFNGSTGIAAPDAWLASGRGFGYTMDATSVGGTNIWQPTTCLGGNTKTGAGCYTKFTSSAPGDTIADHTGTFAGSPLSDSYTMTLKIQGDSTYAAGAYSGTLSLSMVPQF